MNDSILPTSAPAPGAENTPGPESLVLLPGLACDAAVWAPVLPWLPGVQVWLPPSRVHTRIADMAASVLHEAPTERFALAGHSLGGRIALEVLRQAPQRVSRVALLDTGWSPLPAGLAGDAERQQRESLVTLARQSGMRAMGERWSPPMLHPDFLGGPVHEAVLAMIERQSVERFAAQQRALLGRPDAGEVLAGIRCPTLLLCGREDAWSPPARHEEMAARIAGARLEVVPHCGHMSPMEQPEAVGRALAQWMTW